MQIKTLSKSLFNSTEAQGLGDTILHTVKNSTHHNHPVLSVLLNSLKESLLSLSDSRRNSNHNTHTEQVEEADLIRDLAFRAFWLMIDAGTLRQKEEYRLSALIVQQSLKPFDRKLHSFGYNKQSTALQDFFKVMENPEVSQALATMQMQDWLKELQDAQESFSTIYEEKINEESQKQTLMPTIEVKNKAFNQMIALTQTINGLMLGGQSQLEDLAIKLDQVIEEFETKARARKTRKQNDDSPESESPF